MIINTVNPQEDRNLTIPQDPAIPLLNMYLKDSSLGHKDTNLIIHVHCFSIHNTKILERT